MHMSHIMRILALFVFAIAMLAPAHSAGKAVQPSTMVTHIGWTQRALYLGFRVDDSMIVGTAQRPFGQPWLDDAVAVYLHAASEIPQGITEHTLRIIISAAGGYTVQRGLRGEWQDDLRWDLRPIQQPQFMRPQTDLCALKMIGKSVVNDERKADEGFQVELALPWAALGFDPVAHIARTGTLPAMKLTLVNYSQGESTRLYCWPSTVTEEDLQRPARWGTVQLSELVNPTTADEELVEVSRLPGDALIDGRFDAPEWITASIVRIEKPISDEVATSPVQDGQLLLAWYELDPFRRPATRAPLDILHPWYNPQQPLYHSQQLRQARQSGIDALAVVISADARERATQRPRLADLCSAVTRYAAGAHAAQLFDVPLLLPIIDLSMVEDVDLASDEGQAFLLQALGDFYALVPPQLRLSISGTEQRRSYPVILLNPDPSITWTGDFTASASARLRDIAGLPAAWILDSAWSTSEGLSDVLARCPLESTMSYQPGSEGVSMAVITPGLATPRLDKLPRAAGDTFHNALTKAQNSKPEIILLRSWNEFAQGSEVAASRMYGFIFQDALAASTAAMARTQKTSFRILNHTLPATVLPGVHYPLEVYLKNNGMQPISWQQGYRIDYHVMRDGRSILSGTASDRIIMLERSTARLAFTFTTGMGVGKALDPGDYSLQFNVVRNKIPLISSVLLRQRIASVSIPFTVARVVAPLQLVWADIPLTVPTGVSVQATMQVRNTTRSTWKRKATPFRMRWQAESGDALGEPLLIPLPESVKPGSIATLSVNLPAAPRNTGWYRLLLEMPETNATAATVTSHLIQVIPQDLQVEFLNVSLPWTMTTYTVPYETTLLIANRGLSPWPLAKTHIRYQWLSWDGKAIPGAEGSVPLAAAAGDVEHDTEVAVIQPEENILARVSLVPPAGSGSFRCIFGLEVDGVIARNVLGATSDVSPVTSTALNPGRMAPVNLLPYFRQAPTLAATNDAREKINFDGMGNSFPLEEFLPDSTRAPFGYAPGYPFAAPALDAPTFRFVDPIPGGAVQHDPDGLPIYPATGAPVLYASRQVIELPRRKARALYVVATRISDDAPANTFLVRYTDGRRERTNVEVSHWLGDARHGEPVMLRTDHIHTLAGDRWNARGALFVYKIPLDADRVVSRVMLPENEANPANPSIAVFAMTLEVTDPYRWDAATGDYQEWLFNAQSDLFEMDDTGYTPTESWNTAISLLDRVYPTGAQLAEWAGEAYALKIGWPDDAMRASHETLLAQSPAALQALSAAYTYMLRSHHGVYAMAPTPLLDHVFRLRINGPQQTPWPARGIVADVAPAILKQQDVYAKYFVSPPPAPAPKKRGRTPPPAPGPAEQDIFQVLDALNNNLHAAIPALARNASNDQLQEVAALQLSLALYLRQLQHTAPAAFTELCADQEAVRLLLLLYDRASFVLAEARARKLLDTTVADPLQAQLANADTQRSIQALRAVLERE